MITTANDAKVALVVDVEGTGLRGTLFWEACADAMLRNPRRLPEVAGALLRGRGAVERAVASSEIPLPSRGAAELIVRARAAGRPVVLLARERAGLVESWASGVGAELLLAPNGDAPDGGEGKLARIREAYEAFDYVGGSRPAGEDAVVRRAARQVYAVGTGTAGGWQPVASETRDAPRDTWRWAAVLRTLRPHQWVKNTLLFLPAMAAHLPAILETLPALLAGFLAFCGVSSATYILNDLVDLPSDRQHATKRDRPLAAGELSIPHAAFVATGLLLASVFLSLSLPVQFQLVLGAYLVLTVAYSASLKRRPIMDVITLATLYTTRVVAGAALIAVPLSRWFLAFSVFFFFSLALLKRVIELSRHHLGSTKRVPGRGYRSTDLPVLTSLGTTAVMASALVYCLYITSAEVGRLYDQPDLLWLGLPILLFWQSRLWLFVGRGALHDDPVVYALKDRVSRVAFVAFLLVVWVAA